MVTLGDTTVIVAGSSVLNHHVISIGVLLCLYPNQCYSITGLQRMHTTRSPSIPTGVSGDALDLSLSGSQLLMSKRPSSASPGKYFSRSVSVSVASDSRGKRNTLVSSRALTHLCLCGGNRLDWRLSVSNIVIRC